MKKFVLKLSMAIALISASVVLYAQPNWNYTLTSSNHSIVFPATTTIMIDGVAASSNDYVGVFFDSLGTLACGGYFQVDSSNVFNVTAWGTETGLNNGFQAGETFTWKIWRASDNMEFFADATYITGMVPNSDTYVTNGMSGVSSLTAIIGSDLAITNLLSPISGCGLTASENVSFIVQNIGSVDVDTFVVNYSLDGGATMYSDTITQLLASNSSYTFTSTQTFDLSAQGVYQMVVEVFHPLDMSTTDNNLNLSISNVDPPVIDLSGIQTTYCQGIVGHQLTGIPGGGTFGSTETVILGNEVFFAQPGSFAIFYDYTDTSGCMASDTIVLTANPSPVISLPNTLEFCEGSTGELSLPSGFATYTWSTGDTDSLITVSQSGVYSVTVTNSSNCSDSAEVVVSSQAVPVISILGDTEACEGESVELTADPDSSIYAYVWDANGVNLYQSSIDASVSGTYSVTATQTYTDVSCSGTAEVTVTIHPLPVVDLGGDDSMCDGETLTLNAGLFDTFEWNDGSTMQSLDVVDAGTYSVTVADNNGCMGEDEVNISLIELAIAEFSYAVNNMEVSFTNESINADAANTLWVFGDGNTSSDLNPVHTYAQYGSYTVTLYTGNQCGNDSVSYTFDLIGIDDIERQGIVSIFPNPSNGQFNVLLNYQAKDDAQLSIYNILGKAIYQKQITKNSNSVSIEIDLSNEAKGVYFIKLENNDLNYTKKIVIE